MILNHRVVSRLLSRTGRSLPQRRTKSAVPLEHRVARPKWNDVVQLFGWGCIIVGSIVGPTYYILSSYKMKLKLKLELLKKDIQLEDLQMQLEMAKMHFESAEEHRKWAEECSKRAFFLAAEERSTTVD